MRPLSDLSELRILTGHMMYMYI